MSGKYAPQLIAHIQNMREYEADQLNGVEDHATRQALEILRKVGDKSIDAATQRQLDEILDPVDEQLLRQYNLR